jgi:hypothetical protein
MWTTGTTAAGNLLLAGDGGHEGRGERLQVEGRAVAGPVPHPDLGWRYELEAAEEAFDLMLRVDVDLRGRAEVKFSPSEGCRNRPR